MSEKRLTRYNLVNVSEDAKFKIDSCGDWVRYDAVALMIKHLAEAKAALQKYEGAIESTEYVGDEATNASYVYNIRLPKDWSRSYVTVWVKRREG